MQIRKADRHVFDVFLGNGFENWTRVRRYHWGFKVVAGERLSRQAMEEVSKKLERYPNGGVHRV